MSEEIKEKEVKKPARRISEETKQLIANVVITAFSTAAMMYSIAATLKRKDRR